MRKNVFKLFAVLLVLALVLGVVVSCNGKKSTKDFEKIVYTYREAWSVGPLNWNPHTWENSGDSSFMNFITTPLVDTAMGDKPGEWKWEYVAATDVKDITATFANKAKYGIAEDVKEGRVFQIDLNPAMKWETGELIKADDYVESMKLLMEPSMKNYRSNDKRVRDAAVYKADAYFANDLAGTPVYKAWESGAPADAKLMFTFTDNITFFGGTAESYYKNSKYKSFFTVNDVDIFEKYKDNKYFDVTDASKAEILTIAKAFGDDNSEAWKEFCVYDTGEVYPETPWEDVGFFKTGEYQVVYITTQPIEMFYFLTSLGSNWLVHKETYEKNFKTVEKLKGTTYGTDMSNTVSFGPYKIASFEKDKQMRLVRNPYYGGYHDSRLEGQYQADAVIIDIIDNHATVMQRFGQGLVDDVSLTSDDLEKYKKSDRLYFTDESYTDRFIFATSDDALNARDKEKGSGKRIVMRYKDFRKALSLCIDREKFCREATSGFKPAFFLFNGMYYYNISKDPNSVYRNSYYAKKAILDLYGMDSSRANADANYAKITGRDIGYARELFTSAYKQAIADGVYKDGEIVPIEVMASPSELSPQAIKQQDLMQEFIDEGSKGTPFEGKIKIKYEAGDPKRYDNVAAGKNMAIRGAWGGAYFYPFSTIRVYTNPSYMGGLNKIHESNGWDPSKEKLKLKIQRADGSVFEDERTLDVWSDSINGDGDFSKDADEKLQILAALENAVLRSYQCIPVGTYTAASLVSYKIDYPTDVYNIMYGYGGFKMYKFNYTDAEWEEFIKKNQGQLNYE